MPEWVSIDNSVMGKSLLTLFLLVALLLVRVAALQALRTGPGQPEVRRRWLVAIRNASILLFLFFSGAVWATELRTFALSLVAIAAAIAIATKELIQCLIGSFYRSSSRLYSVGDRIEVGSHRGDVIDLSLLSTTLLEVGPKTITHQQTGRAITFPNSLLLTASVINETYSHDYVLHTFAVPLSFKKGWETAPDILLKSCEAETADFMTEARKHFIRLGQKNALEVPSPDPRVTLQIPRPDEVTMVARIPTPARLKGRIEQRILQRFLSTWAKETPEASSAAEA